MTIIQTTVEISTDRRITLKVPSEVPIGKASLEYKIIPFQQKEEKIGARDIELFEKYAEELNAEAEDVLSYQNMYMDEAEDKQPAEE